MAFLNKYCGPRLLSLTPLPMTEDLWVGDQWRVHVHVI